jgi:drug/metabolite transporter (DMT)-like permease
MLQLLLASLLWAPSFGLIKARLAGVDPGFVAFVRLALSALLFLPLVRTRVRPRLAAELAAVGAVQHGLMYLFYLHAFRSLAGHEVALFTVFTPVYVTLLHDATSRRFHRLFLLAALLAVAGAAVIVFRGTRPPAEAFRGFLMVQGSNLCFAFGQVRYARIAEREGGFRDRDVFAWLYLGACVAAAALLPRALAGGVPRLDAAQWLTLIYLGLVPSGIGFFLWNAGARRARSGTLAALNNAKIPRGVRAAVVLFGERVAALPLVAGAVAIAAAAAAGELRGVGRGQKSEVRSQ